MLEDAQKQAGLAGRTISDKTILPFDSTVMLTEERYPKTNYDWEDISKEHKTCADWKSAYKKRTSKRM